MTHDKSISIGVRYHELKRRTIILSFLLSTHWFYFERTIPRCGKKSRRSFEMSDCTLLEKLMQCDSTRLEKVTRFTYSTLVEELTQFPVKDVLQLILTL